MINKALMTSNSVEWGTPKKFYNELDEVFKFNLDPCATKENYKCKNYYTKEDDGLSKIWNGNVYVNPPYGRKIIDDWSNKIITELNNYELCVALPPSRTDTKWFLTLITNATLVCFVKGRLKFNDGKVPAPFPSALFLFTKHKITEKQFECFKKFGFTIKLK